MGNVGNTQRKKLLCPSLTLSSDAQLRAGAWLMAVTCHPCRADHVINQQEEDIVQRVLEITGGEGAYAALDPVAGDFTSTVSYRSAIPQAVVWSACRPGGCARLGTGVHRVCGG